MRLILLTKWPHIIDNRSNDGADILFRRNGVVGQNNNILCNFYQAGAAPKLKLLKSYCNSHYGCELWNLFHDGISYVRASWCKP